MISKFRGEYFFLSNFYEVPVKYDGIIYQNNEAAFQAQKCITYEDRVAFASMNPYEAKKYGRKVNLRPDWEQVKVQEMEKIVRAKFNQNLDLATQLVATTPCRLEEGNTWNDRVWGTVNGQGTNLLGEILMKIRDELREYSE